MQQGRFVAMPSTKTVSMLSGAVLSGAVLLGAQALPSPVAAQSGTLFCQQDIDELQSLLRQKLPALTPQQAEYYRDRLAVARSRCNSLGSPETQILSNLGEMRAELEAIPTQAADLPPETRMPETPPPIME